MLDPDAEAFQVYACLLSLCLHTPEMPLAVIEQLVAFLVTGLRVRTYSQTP